MEKPPRKDVNEITRRVLDAAAAGNINELRHIFCYDRFLTNKIR